MEVTFSLPGVTYLNCMFAVFGWILMYNILPETEGRSLADIEMHFSDKSKKLTDHKIPKSKISNNRDACDVNEMKNRSVSMNGKVDHMGAI